MPQPTGDAPILATKLFVPPPRDNVVNTILIITLAVARFKKTTA